MKKLLLLLLGVVILGSCSVRASRDSGREITSVRSVHPFDQIEIKGLCDVKYKQGDSFGVKIVGDEEMVNQILTEFDGRKLSIKPTKRKVNISLNRRKHTPVVYITSPDLIGIHMEGAGDFEVEGLLDTDTLNVYLKGAGDVDLERVICDEAYITLKGMGDIDIDGLTAQRSVLNLQGVGDVEIEFVNSGSATCRLEGVGDIKLSGNLKSLQKTVKGTGSINVKKLKLEQ
jgi:hypothetical protein